MWPLTFWARVSKPSDQYFSDSHRRLTLPGMNKPEPQTGPYMCEMVTKWQARQTDCACEESIVETYIHYARQCNTYPVVVPSAETAPAMARRHRDSFILSDLGVLWECRYDELCLSK